MLPSSEPIGAVVVCEDDAATLELLCDHLQADRFEVYPAPSAADALRHCQYSNPDLLLLDLALPDASGLDVLRAIRSGEGSTSRFDPGLPVIILTGRGADHDRARGIEEGASDYIVKPFYFPELAARMRSAIRNRCGERGGPIKVGDLSVDPASREVRVGGELIELAKKEYELLLMLASEPRRVFTKAELLRAVWDFKTLGRTRTLDAHASRLRRKLDPESGRFVANVWGVGYRLLPA